MNGICGWAGSGQAVENPERVLANMGTALATGQQTARLTTPACSLATTLPTTGAGVYTQDNLCIAFCGDIFWRQGELQATAAAQGHDAAIATAYHRYGIQCLEHMHGPFSLALHDPAQQITLLAIDRLGIHRLCYTVRDQQLVFATSLDTLIRHPAVQAEIDPQAIYDYLYFHMVPGPRTIYRDIYKLAPGQYALFKAGVLTNDVYWQLEYQDDSKASFQDLDEEFRALLRTTVTRAAAHPHTGSFLSGGTDSSTTTGILSELSTDPVQSFSIGFKAEGYDETPYATISAKHFHTRHQTYYVTPQDVVSAIPLVAVAYDEPFGNASAIPTYYCAKIAKAAGVSHMIACDGGDEIFAGNARYAKQQVFEHYQRLPAALRHGLIEPIVRRLPDREALPLLRKAKSYIDQARIPLPDRLETYNFLHRTPPAEMFQQDFIDRIDRGVPLNMLRSTYQQAHSGSQLNRMMYLDMKYTLADNDLRKVSRMCGLAGVAVHYPLLDEELVGFAARVPVNLKIRNGELRYFFKQSLRDFLAPETLVKSKHGFGLPFGLWLHEDPRLHELAHHSLQQLAKRAYLQPAYLDGLWKQHQQGHASYYGVMIWVLMMLEQWLAAHGH
ncbi:MAG: hypothetical protein A2V90_00660 [Gammaproteobacteria bacterium RBG_16_57_12]|nr:MAG: hypothetical protein A2V90_00660 [Gammaproteobacteria bacterium RBG_16_57_12]